jgi:glycosyltransferase involved in cell wall biosynthesis
MRILLVSPYPPTLDGIGTYAQSLAGELAAQGNEVRVISARAAEPTPPEVLGAVSRRGGPDEDRLLSDIDAFAPEVVHVQFAVAAYAASVFAVMRLMRRLRDRGYPVITTMHEVTRDTNSLRGPGRALYRALAAGTDLAILHTQGAAKCLAELLGGTPLRVEVIPHPSAALPDPEVTEAELRSEFGLEGQRVVLSFGFIDIDKGIQDLIRAVSLLRRDPRLRNVRLVIAGTVRRRFGPFRIFEFRDRAYFAYLQRIIRRLEMEQQVVMTGYVPSGAMQPWFELASVAALPYRRCEASGVANIALAVGTPLVTTAVGELVSLSSVPELKPADPVGFAAGLTQVLASDVSSLGASASEGVDFAAVAARTAALYAELPAHY